MKKGQVLIEVLLAFAASVIAIVGLVQLSTRSVSNSGIAGRQTLATTYATEGMEWIRGQRDTMGWAGFYGVSGTKCLNSIPAAPANILSLPASCGATKIGTTEFSRSVTLTPGVTGLKNTQQVLVLVSVTWQEGVRMQGATESSIFSTY